MKYAELNKEQKDFLIEWYFDDIDVHDEIIEDLKDKGYSTINFTINRLIEYFDNLTVKEQEEILGDIT